MNIVLFDDQSVSDLLPFTFTRPAADLRIGILKISEKWEFRLKQKNSWLTQAYLQSKYPLVIKNDNLLINGSLLPGSELVQEVLKLENNESLVKGEVLLAARLPMIDPVDFFTRIVTDTKKVEYKPEIRKINYPWDIFRLNGEEIVNDFSLITKGRNSAPLSKSVGVIGEENIFIESGAKLEFVTLNATSGPIYVGRDSEIMEGSHIRGPFAILEHSQLKLGTKIYGPTTIGPHCKIGGELNNVVIFGFSNKSHDGFLGNSVIGEWCNIGAGSNCSNLKNNYAGVKVWNYPRQKFIETGLQFCGLLMGDHSKCGINTMFNTGTIVGVNCNIFGDGFLRNFIPDFSWGGPQGFTVFDTQKAFEVAQKVMERRNINLSESDKMILQEVYNLTIQFRKF